MTLTRTNRAGGAAGLSIVALLVSALLIAIPSPSSAAAVTCDGHPVTILGTPGDDVLTGTAGIDVIHGLGGNDIIKGYAHKDILCGGTGDDILYGGKHGDRMFGGAGDDELYGSFGHDWLFGGKDNDYLNGGGGDDFMSGRLGNDRVTGGDGADTVIGNEGDDTLIGGPGPDDVYGGPGTDMCAGNTELTCEGLAYDYRMQRFLINQAVPAADSSQAPGDRVGTVEARGGIVRAFISGNQPGIPSPTVHLYWKIDGVAGKALMDGPATLPQNPQESDLSTTFNYEFDETFLTPGAEMFVLVDRADEVLEIKETNNRYPNSGWGDIDTRDVPRMRITVVPIDGVSLSQTQAEALFDKTFRVHPVADSNVFVRAPYVCSGCTGDLFQDWQTLLFEIRSLQANENPNRMYHAIVPLSWGQQTGIGGIGFIGIPAAVSIPNEETIAHETGHNLGLWHNLCTGQEANPDPDFPYSNGSIGNWGYDPASGTTYDPAVFVDLMTYCSPEWVSDFSFGKVLDYRSSGAVLDVQADGLVAAGTGTVVEFSGLVPANEKAAASLALTPAAERVPGHLKTEITSVEIVDGPAILPAAGDHTLVGVDANGEALVSVAFQAYAISHAPGAHFYFSIEVDEATLSSVVGWNVMKGGELVVTRAAD